MLIWRPVSAYLAGSNSLARQTRQATRMNVGRALVVPFELTAIVPGFIENCSAGRTQKEHGITTSAVSGSI